MMKFVVDISLYDIYEGLYLKIDIPISLNDISLLLDRLCNIVGYHLKYLFNNCLNTFLYIII